MEREIICLDTSILIEYFRKSNKDNSVLFRLIKNKYLYAVSIFTIFEIYNGAKENQINFWKELLKDYTIIPFNTKENLAAIDIYKQLKLKNKLIQLPDIFIAATAMANNLKLVTLNKKHFERIEGLEMLNLK